MQNDNIPNDPVRTSRIPGRCPGSIKTIPLLILILLTGCLKPEKYYKSPVFGIEIESKNKFVLGDISDKCWLPFSNLGIDPPWRTVEISEEDSIECGCVGWYSNLSAHVVFPYAALPHELAHVASVRLYGHPQADHNWTPEVRNALNLAADQIGMGHEY